MRPPKENIVIYNYKSNYEPKRSSRTVGVESGDGAKDRRTGVAETQDGVDKEGNAEGRLTRRMGMKDEALELADFLEKNMVAAVAILGDVTATHIVSTLRQQQAEIEALSKSLSGRGTPDDELANHKIIIKRLQEKLNRQTKPLSDEEIEELREYHGINDWLYETSIVDFVRAVEKAHGIQ